MHQPKKARSGKTRKGCPAEVLHPQGQETSTQIWKRESNVKLENNAFHDVTKVKAENIADFEEVFLEDCEDIADDARLASSGEPGSLLPVLCELMLGMGDWPAPLTASAELMEPIIARELSALVARALRAPWRPSAALEPERLLLALRRDALMTSRMLGYLEFRHVRLSVASSVQQTVVKGAWHVLVRCRALVEELGVSPPPAADQEARARRERLDRLTSAMTRDEYKAFSRVRRFCPSHWRACEGWLRRLWPAGAPPPTAATRGALLFLLRELLTLLVDAALLVREESSARQPVGGLPARSLAPDHVREAVRRLQMAAPPRADTLLVT
ncbi:uncharacterized protein LOC119095099 [Pollicipes pollicipes]|uniref:uncharacterized protein LOC119095099 n=1 Tax=Pollicipes pollicipes TaxID=41117 RepID=UPI00188538A1|nr:uncharacterized protein LOC119095099 [Pollicipes pollicipes]